MGKRPNLLHPFHTRKLGSEEQYCVLATHNNSSLAGIARPLGSELRSPAGASSGKSRQAPAPRGSLSWVRPGGGHRAQLRARPRPGGEDTPKARSLGRRDAGAAAPRRTLPGCRGALPPQPRAVQARPRPRPSPGGAG